MDSVMSVADVYDIAADIGKLLLSTKIDYVTLHDSLTIFSFYISVYLCVSFLSGKEFERLIDSHGPEHVTELMQKVISALEHLEQFASSADSERDTIECLQRTVTHLELEEAKKVEERQRNDLELQQIEEHYKQETRDLLATVKKLQDENRKLASSLAAAHEQSRDSAFSEDGEI